MNRNHYDFPLELLKILGKSTSPREAGEILEKESSLVNELFLSMFSIPFRNRSRQR